MKDVDYKKYSDLSFQYRSSPDFLKRKEEKTKEILELKESIGDKLNEDLKNLLIEFRNRFQDIKNKSIESGYPLVVGTDLVDLEFGPGIMIPKKFFEKGFEIVELYDLGDGFSRGNLDPNDPYQEYEILKNWNPDAIRLKKGFELQGWQDIWISSQEC